jgi:hypothetical protein
MSRFHRYLRGLGGAFAAEDLAVVQRVERVLFAPADKDIDQLLDRTSRAFARAGYLEARYRRVLDDLEDALEAAAAEPAARIRREAKRPSETEVRQRLLLDARYRRRRRRWRDAAAVANVCSTLRDSLAKRLRALEQISNNQRQDQRVQGGDG